MTPLPTDWSALCALVFLLGMRHGFDADHLATIDSLTRLNRARSPALARACGALFSLGHGAVVLLIAAGVGSAGAQWVPPQWLEGLGAGVSIAFLLGLGIVNLRAVLSAAPDQAVVPVGLKGRWLRRLVQARSPVGVAAVGALFALSFDTLSQAALFAATGVQAGGTGHALLLGGLFVAGMLFTDGLNGWWIARLIARSDALAAVASRTMGAAVAGVSLLVGSLGLARWLSPHLDAWSDAHGLGFGLSVLAVLVLAYGLAHVLARRRPRPAVAA